MSKFPFYVDLEQRGIGAPPPNFKGYWFPDEKLHKEVVQWLKHNTGIQYQDWYCLEAGYYYFKKEDDAMIFKLRWL